MNPLLDYFNRKDKPSIVLLNPSLTPVASLGAAYNVSSTLRFNGISELSFAYPMSIDNGKTRTQGYDNIKVKMVIELEGVGRYIISECPETSDGSIPVKNITAQSLESELLYKRIVGLSGTFKFGSNPPALNTIMGKVIEQSKDWSVGIIDEELSEMYRTFDVGNNTVYNFLTSDVVKAFNCVFIFNTFSKTIDAKLIKNLENHTGAFISLDNANRSITITEYSDEISTALNCYGGSDLDIHRVNPLGTNTIYNFDYYVNDNTNEWMSPNLKKALTEWKNHVIEKEQYYREITLKNNIAIEEYTTISQTIDEYQSALDALQIKLEGLQAIPTVTEDDNTREARLAEINKTEIDIANTQMAIRIARNNKSLKRQKIDENLAELRIITNSLKFTGEESWRALVDDVSSVISRFSEIASGWRAVIFETADDLEIDIPQFASNIPLIETLIGDISSELGLLYTSASDKLIQYWYLNSSDKTSIATRLNNISEKIDNLCYMFDNLISGTDMAINLRSDSKLLWSYGSIISNDNNLTKEEYAELEHFIFYNTYTNNNIIITDIMTEENIQEQALTLYDQSVEVLKRTSNPRYEISGDFISIINAPEFSDLVEKLDLGKQVTIELPDGNKHVDVTLLETSYNYDSPDSFTMTFSNRVKLNTSNFKFADMFLGITGGDNTGLSGITNGNTAQASPNTNILSETNALISKLGFISFGPTPPQKYGNYVGTWLGYDNGAKFSLYSSATDYLQWTGDRLLIKAKNFTLDSNGNITAHNADLSGKITAASGDIAGWKIEENQLSSTTGNFRLNSSTPKLTLGDTSDYKNGEGVFMGKYGDSYAFSVGDSNGDYFAWNKDGIDISGDWIAGWTISPSALSSGSGSNYVELNSASGSPAIIVGGETAETADFIVNKDGSIIANNATIRGHVEAETGKIGGWEITETSIEKGYIQLNSNSCRINVGNTTSGEGIVIDGPGGYIQSGNYVDSSTGFKIYNNGDAEFNNVNVRGEIRSSVFKYDEISSVAGTIGVFKSSAVIINDSEFIDSRTPMTISTELPSNFEINDIVRIKDNVAKDVWAKITGSSIISGSQTNYYCSVQYASAGAYTFKAGTTVVNYGKTGDGYLWMRAADSMGGSTVRPYYSVRTSGSSPWNDGFIEHVRLGSLTGALNTGFDLDGKYGIVIGNSGSYLIYNSDDGMRIKGDITADSGYLTNLTINGVLTLDTNGRLQQGSGTWGTDFTGTAIWSESGAMNIGGLNNNVKQWWGGSDGTLYAGQGNIRLDKDGIKVEAPSAYNPQNRNNLKWYKQSDILFNIGAVCSSTGDVYSRTMTNGLSGGIAETYIASIAQGTNSIANIELVVSITDGKFSSLQLLNDGNTGVLSVEVDTADLSGNLVVDGTIKDGSGVEYLKTNGKAADSDKLDNIDSTGFVQTSGNQTVDGIKTFSSIPVLPSTNPSTANQAVRKGYADATYLGITAKAADSDKLDGKDSTEFLLTTGKAADSDRLDGIDSAGYVNTDYTQSIGGVKYFTNIPILPSTDPTSANQAVRKGYADATYLGISAKAADADKLDGLDSTAFGRPVFLTTPKTSTSWDGDTKTTSDRAIIDLSSVFGVPAGVKAVLMSIQTQAAAANNYIRFGPSSTYSYALTCRTAVAEQIANAMGIVPCDSNGDIYCYVSQGTVENVYVWIWGWWL